MGGGGSWNFTFVEIITLSFKENNQKKLANGIY